MQFLTLVDDTEEEEAEESIDRLFSCLDSSDSSSSGSSSDEKPRKSKKKSKKSKDDEKKSKRAKKVGHFFVSSQQLSLDNCLLFEVKNPLQTGKKVQERESGKQEKGEEKQEGRTG